jgi:plasmid stability protein
MPNCAMASIAARNLSEDTKARLRERASASGRSLESCVRALLDQSANTDEGAKSMRFPHDLIGVGLLNPSDLP